MSIGFRLLPLLALTLAPAAARADDDESGAFWFTPLVEAELDDNTAVQVEGSMRLRSAAAGADTYSLRLWLEQGVAPGVNLSAGIEKRVNGGAADEVRLLQQIAWRSGILRVRVRTEQRFIDGADQMALRIRPRIGVDVPLDAARRWRAVADVEAGFTLQPARFGGQTGQTGLRTRVGGTHQLSDQWQVGAYYLRNQEVLKGRPDRVTHAPLLTVRYSF